MAGLRFAKHTAAVARHVTNTPHFVSAPMASVICRVTSIQQLPSMRCVSPTSAKMALCSAAASYDPSTMPNNTTPAVTFARWLLSENSSLIFFFRSSSRTAGVTTVPFATMTCLTPAKRPSKDANVTTRPLNRNLLLSGFGSNGVRISVPAPSPADWGTSSRRMTSRTIRSISTCAVGISL